MVKLGRVREFGKVRRGNEEEIELDLEDEDEGGVPVALKGGKAEEKTKGFGKMQLPSPVNVTVRGGNGDEIPLDLHDEDEGPRYEDTNRPAPADAREDGPAYLDTSEDPPTEAAAAEIETYRTAMFARNPPGAGGVNDEDDAPPDDEDGDARPTTSYTSTLAPPPFDLPQRPSFSDTGFMQGSSRGAFSDSGSVSSRGGRGRGRGGHGGQRGEYNKLWYEGYYDPNFNENPWARLEKEKGLQSVGTWVERPAGKYDSRREEMS